MTEHSASRERESGREHSPGGRPTETSTSGTDGELAAWTDALQVAALLAVDPHGLGGVTLVLPHGALREAWLACLRAALPPSEPMRRMPGHIAEDRLLGGLDLSATLAAGRPIAQRGLLADADGGILLLGMAERCPERLAAHLAAAMDTGEISLARETLSGRQAARFAVVAFDEGRGEDESPPVRLLERQAFRLDLSTVTLSMLRALPGDATLDGAQATLAARALLANIAIDATAIEAVCATAQALGVDSARAPIFALRAARAAAALAGREIVSSEDLSLAVRLVCAHRATRMPELAADVEVDPGDDADQDAHSPAEAQQRNEADAASPERESAHDDEPSQPVSAESMQEMLLAAAAAALPAGLLARLAMGRASGAGAGGGRAGAFRESRLRGRPLGARPGLPRGGARLALIDTLRAAAPWQKLRAPPAGRIAVRATDLRVARLRERNETTTIFAVDASGSSALHRLAEAKGAVELLLADCYVRRDKVAVVAFRGRNAELLLPPTRSLVRAKRSLAGLPGGGGTPLAAGIEAAGALAQAIGQRGGTPVIVLLTDGKANVARDGSGGRPLAEQHAQEAARQVRLQGHTTLLIDTSPQPQPAAHALAQAMGAGYLPLPRADAARMSAAVQAATRAPMRAR